MPGIGSTVRSSPQVLAEDELDQERTTIGRGARVDIASWLSGLGLGQYEQTFLDNNVDAEGLPELRADDLMSIGVTSIGYRRKAAITALREGVGPSWPRTNRKRRYQWSGVAKRTANPDVQRSGRLDGGVRISSSPYRCRDRTQLRAASRNEACNAVSRVLRNRDLSLLVNGAGPRVLVPNSRRCRAISRPASAFPIFACVHCVPVEDTTRAPILRQRDASGTSDVTHTSTAVMCFAIQSSAASALLPTRTMLTLGVFGGRIGREPLETTKTLSRSRAATR